MIAVLGLVAWRNVVLDRDLSVPFPLSRFDGHFPATLDIDEPPPVVHSPILVNGRPHHVTRDQPRKVKAEADLERTRSRHAAGKGKSDRDGRGKE